MFLENFSVKWKKAANGANLITLLGIWFAVIVVYLRYKGQAGFSTAALTLLAILTDYLDGIYARRYKCETEVGAILDRTRDKLLAGSYFWFIMRSYQIKADLFLGSIFTATIAPLAIIEAALLVFGFWGISKNKSVKSNAWGKRKMFFECVGMGLWVVFNDIAPFGFDAINPLPAAIIALCFFAGFFLAGMSLWGYYERYFGNP